eukprot:TRINITY_DN9530_c0_g1_i9.p1 TRINITY_DN9530_c0_g1~~TRINITY_DN9530_c0_g1_i9.p1  ORF type:complete len:298 (-),score=78.77 TRINITY_DN9530_c0_g1_i9:230-1123(-)
MIHKPTAQFTSCAVQTESSDAAKIVVYEKIEDATRYKLIQMQQQKNMTLKEAAEKLDINYSTAKTIVQTYRKENRISRKPKHMKETKKSIRREEFLSRVLTQAKLAKLFPRVIQVEFGSPKKKKSPKLSQSNSEARTLAATGQPQDNPPFKAFHRIESAGQMQIIESEVEGPRPGQVSRAVTVDVPQNVKKDIFHVRCEQKEENAFECKNLVLPKSREKKQLNKAHLNMCKIKEDAAVDKKLLPEVEERKDNEEQVSALKAIERSEEKREEKTGVHFDFSEYGRRIMEKYGVTNSQM